MSQTIAVSGLTPSPVRRPLPTQAFPAFDRRRILAFVAMVFGMFMAILDIQIVSASLSEIQAGLSASADEISWVQTSYLVAEVVMIPLSGYLSRAFSTRYLFTLSAAGFTLMSFMCATSNSLSEMIVWRALQGFIGGGMIPSVFAAAFTIFPRDKQAIVTPVIGLVATLAPTVGPTIGGVLTDTFSWHWLFLVNILPGIVVTTAAWFLIDFDRPKLSLLRQLDWLGLAGMAAFLGALEYVLEEGPSKNWFEEQVIVVAAAISFVGAALFFWRAMTSENPIVDLSAFRDRNFWTGSISSLVLGVGLYGLTYLNPVYLARVRGYSALMIGNTMFVSGIAMFLTAPIAGRLSAKFDPRIIIALGFLIFSLGTLQASYVTKDWDFYELLVPQILRGIALMFCIVPITNLSLGTLPPHLIKNASGLFNLTRNLGGAIGLAVINTVMNDRMDLHLARLHERIAWGYQPAEEALANLTQAFAARGSDAALAATKQLALLVRREATVMAIGDVFLALTVLSTAIVLLTPAMRRPRPVPPGAGGH